MTMEQGPPPVDTSLLHMMDANTIAVKGFNEHTDHATALRTVRQVSGV